jgi:hypothetical protein
MTLLCLVFVCGLFPLGTLALILCGAADELLTKRRERKM